MRLSGVKDQAAVSRKITNEMELNLVSFAWIGWPPHPLNLSLLLDKEISLLGHITKKKMT